ncbi:hypothetical protein [Nocardiopsis nanhaiensis]
MIAINQEPAVIVAVVSAAISMISMLFAYRGTRIARKAYNLSLSQDVRANLPIDSELGIGARKKVDLGDLMLYKILARNPSTVSNSIARAALKVRYSNGKGEIFSVDISQLERGQITEDNFEDEPTRFPMPLPAGEAKIVHLAFLIPYDIVKGYQIEDYTIKLEDSLGRVTEVGSISVALKKTGKDEEIEED